MNLDKIITSIETEISQAESLKARYPKMDSQQVIDLLNNIVKALKETS